jgi:hypothetical protein
MSKKSSIRKVLKLIAVDELQYNRLRELIFLHFIEQFNTFCLKLIEVCLGGRLSGYGHCLGTNGRVRRWMLLWC